jgi:DNA helicase HerA-like ATPase
MTTQSQQFCIGARISGELEMLDPEERLRHLYVVGQTGTGKSTLRTYCGDRGASFFDFA